MEKEKEKKKKEVGIGKIGELGNSNKMGKWCNFFLFLLFFFVERRILQCDGILAKVAELMKYYTEYYTK